MNETVGLVLAAGMGKRIKSNKPKALHEVGGLPIIDHVIRSLNRANINEIIVVVGCEGEQIQEHLKDKVKYVWQKEQLGTAHAVMQAEEILKNFSGDVVVLPGDAPLIKPETIIELLFVHKDDNSAASVLTMELEDAASYGRIIRDERNQFEKIVEFKDASDDVRKIKEVNSGSYCFNSKNLFSSLLEISNDNSQKEYYLTDTLEILRKKNLPISVVKMKDSREGLGVNSRRELAMIEEIMRDLKRVELMDEGVTLIDPKSTFIDYSVIIGRDTVIKPFCTISGDTVIGSDCVIGPSANISNCIIGDSNEISTGFMSDSTILNNCHIGPYFRIRPGTRLSNGVKVGHFVELKNTQVGEFSKIPHLSYLGDAIIGKEVNVGCGVITCNYDGLNKYHTIIEDKCFIGSNSNLIAPVVVGEEAYVASGSTIDQDVEPSSLAIARCRQENKTGWVKRRKSIQKQDKIMRNLDDK